MPEERKGEEEPVAKGSRRRLSAEKRREKIANAAGEVFAKRGYHAASMAEIASRSGVSKAVVYDHFESKQALHQYLLDSQVSALLEVAAAAVGEAGTPKQRLRRGMLSFLEFMRAHPTARRLLFNGDGAAPEIARTFQRVQRKATLGLAALIADEPRFLANDPQRTRRIEILAQMLRGGLNELAAWGLAHPRAPLEELADVALALYWPGLNGMLVSERELALSTAKEP
jgi:AcrR family transcriptional regulator